MATSIKISALPVASGIDGSADYLPIVQTGVTNKINRNTLLGLTSAPLGLTDSQSVSNKTLDNTSTINIKGTKFTLQDDSDTTKQARFIMSSITTANTRSFTLPDRTDTIVTLGGAQTLTSKTLTTPTITGPSVTGTVGGSATYSTPTLTQPTIADFTNATHNHSNAAGGGSTLTSPTINTPVISSPTMRGWDGWEDANEAWTYSSAVGITVPSDATTKYAVGDKIKLTQSATVKYFYIVAVTSTLLTVTGGSDYTVANSAITANFYSHTSSPLGFPAWFNYTPSWTGFSANPTFSTGIARFQLASRQVTFNLQPSASGTSNSTSLTVSLPISASSVANFKVTGNTLNAIDNGAGQTSPGSYTITSSDITTASLFKDVVGTGWTNTGSKRANGLIVYEI